MRNSHFLYKRILNQIKRQEIKEGQKNKADFDKNIFKVNGIADYWGRYATLTEIITLTSYLKPDDESDYFTFYFPSKESNYYFSHVIGIHWHVEKNTILFEFTPSSSQCGSFEKVLKISALPDEIAKLKESTSNLEERGYIWCEY